MLIQIYKTGGFEKVTRSNCSRIFFHQMKKKHTHQNLGQLIRRRFNIKSSEIKSPIENKVLFIRKRIISQ